MSFLAAFKAPVINDVTTNVRDPPAYIKATSHPPTLSPGLQATITKAYPDLRPLRVPGGSAADVFVATKKALAVLPRASVVAESAGAEGGKDWLLEAVDVTALLRFKDDVIIR